MDIYPSTNKNNAYANLNEYKLQLQRKLQTTNTNKPTRSNDINWSPPPANALKFNVDAHYNGDGHWGLGWIVRKEDGSCLGATTRTVRARTAMEAEALGLVAMLHSIHQQEERPIIIHYYKYDLLLKVLHQWKRCQM
ncbi:hypothetical protein A2U01_0013361 [Trifolium medium]|uniref:RNase H type-1 domain-containing protein n=1 Tax=Trifolium medium TaxID=97028 RepID=A0A392MYM8_9FABA|nr:hypothetical protein [Trifolium medium]